MTEEREDIKIVYLNINGLLHAEHIAEMKCDNNLMTADVICIAETKLSDSVDPDSVILDGFETISRLDFKTHSMGIMLFTNDRTKPQMANVKSYIDRKNRTQMIRCEIENIPITFVYIHPSHVARGLKFIQSQLNNDEILMGDFNIDSSTPRGIRQLERFCHDIDMKSVLHTYTRYDSSPDHILIRQHFPHQYTTDAYKKLYSDHCAISLRFSKNAIGLLDMDVNAS